MVYLALVMALVLALFLVASAVTIGLFVVAWYDHVNFQQTPDEPGWRKNIRPLAILAGVAGECLAMFLCLLLYPLHRVFDRDPKTIRPGSRPPVVFVHGWGMASHVFDFIRPMLKKLGYNNLFSVTHRPVLCCTAKAARQVADKIDLALARTGTDRAILITHSMGGVLARYAIKNLGAANKVDTVITLGGPHMGSRIAVFCPMGKNTLQMTYNSRFVQDLAEGGLTPGKARYVSIYSLFDNSVVPPQSSNLGPGAKNIQVPFHGHMSLLFSPRVLSIIKKELV